MSETKSQSPEPSTEPDSVSPKPQVPLPSDCAFFVHGPPLKVFQFRECADLRKGPARQNQVCSLMRGGVCRQ